MKKLLYILLLFISVSIKSQTISFHQNFYNDLTYDLPFEFGFDYDVSSSMTGLIQIEVSLALYEGDPNLDLSELNLIAYYNPFYPYTNGTNDLSGSYLLALGHDQENNFIDNSYYIYDTNEFTTLLDPHNTGYDYVNSNELIPPVNIVESYYLPIDQFYFIRVAIWDTNNNFIVYGKPIYMSEIVCRYSSEEGVFHRHTTLSTNDLTLVENVIYPNPVFDVLNFSELIESETYKILNNSGQLIQQGVFESNIDVSFLPSGLYLLVTETGTVRFIKQ